LAIRLENIVYLLSPFQLFTSEGGQAISQRIWALSLYSIPGALGLGLLVPAFLAAAKKLRSWTLTLFIFIPVLLCAIVIGWPKGLGALHFAEAVVLLLTGLSIYFLLAFKRPLWLMGAFIINIAQLLFFIYYSYRDNVGGWFHSPEDIIIILMMAGICTVCGFSIRQVIRGKRIIPFAIP
jgi:hypothetical protein